MGLPLKSLRAIAHPKKIEPYTKISADQRSNPLIYTEGQQIYWQQHQETGLTLLTPLLKQALTESVFQESLDLSMWTMTVISMEDKSHPMSFGFTNTVGSTLCLKPYSVYWEENLKDSLQ